MYLLGFDIGSSSVKASLINGETGKCVASSFFPKNEMKITAIQAGWAEQHPDLWWENLKLAVTEVMQNAKIPASEINSIGISYQMHGLVVVDKNQQVLRPSIIWCDSRAAGIGEKAFQEIGAEKCLSSLLNSPGNFTASKLKWVKDNEPELYSKIDKIMLPGDYIAMKLTGEIKTTASGLSEGILWNFRENNVASLLLDHYGISSSFIPEIVPTFSIQGELSKPAANELGLAAGIKISYRAGDQPNNALSLNVLNPGEIATTAGTSGVVYGVSGEVKYDPFSRVNTFAHVNHSAEANRLGVLLCINGTGILNSWLHKYAGSSSYSYEEMNNKAAEVAIGSDGLTILPFGNGAERVLRNKNMGARFSGINFNIHSDAHLFRAAQEGIVFSFKYGMDIMKNMGIDAQVIRAGKANMFLSPVFRETLAGVSGATIELYNTDGSIGAARGAGIGSGYYSSAKDAFASLEKLETVVPDESKKAEYEAAYNKWKAELEK
ncbi:MAG: carbohydrate kinase [Bacteroidetes bacterium GWF2_42_66]|nr:MAG: carbohydrate kinase [Bacteroidetes bacterium GWA2_42_15]OFY03529.1 MAG: carbohydrate kinase [Bacteroidetes bacterium GWE2_42_39]OFY45895.1 MAG: carbohydrate kinase [Bacteroidetes bacterium GWF2_42_66]HBL75137.1 carbohydrate kinase [Prolixibacteraceae bacterium]HCR91623.1 carbohydrate kinase [Prolixibacteraceae bacterium]